MSGLTTSKGILYDMIKNLSCLLRKNLYRIKDETYLNEIDWIMKFNYTSLKYNFLSVI